MKPLIRERIRKKYRREQSGNKEKECCFYDYCPIDSSTSLRLSHTGPDLCNQPEQDENNHS